MLKLDETSPPELEADQTAALDFESDQKQRRQMLIALALLLVALVLVLIKDRDFWFPSTPVAESEQSDDSETAAATPPETQATPAPPVTAPASKPKQHLVAKATEPPAPEPALAPEIPNRTVLPPLEVEVIAGDEHRVVRPGNSAVSVDLQPKTPVVPSATTPPAVTASTGVHLSPGAVELLSRPVEPTYPLLAKQMKVQGAVVLKALIGKEGNIQDLHVLSGPAILSAAAREAVKQWRFRPYLQAGKAVETEARITVNFTISTQ
ncbi:MAG TPA: TonB family protein [Terriglobales bacterium]|nr:TonB family protein [Terriglobales bacterium]